MTPLVIFDLDGTLADSKTDLCASVNYVRKRFGIDVLPGEEIARMIGDGAEALIRRALGDDAPDARVEDALHLFLQYYGEHMLDQTRLYPGVLSSLDALGVCKLAVLTNKPYRFSRRMLEGLGIYDRFSAVYGGNSFPQKKPDPVGVNRIMADTGTRTEAAWMVGDSAVDVKAGRAAGIRTCGVTYGYAPETFEAHPPDHLIDALNELPTLVLSQGAC
jgi:phosphoglycolate phosphatase